MAEITVDGKKWEGSETNTAGNVADGAKRAAGEAITALGGKPGKVEVSGIEGCGDARVTVEIPDEGRKTGKK